MATLSSATPNGTAAGAAGGLVSNAAGLVTLDIVETNRFKHLTHLSLRFIAGDDTAIKGYLAARLRMLKVRSAHH